MEYKQFFILPPVLFALYLSEIIGIFRAISQASVRNDLRYVK